MKKFASIVMLAGLGLATSGCSMLSGIFGGGGVDMAETMKNSPAMWQIQLHDGAEEGQYYEWDSSGSTQFWGVTGTRDGNLVVENRMETANGWYTIAYVCELDGTVNDAFVANYDPEAEELSEGIQLKIMDKPEPVDAPPGDEPETGDETVNTAGEDFACTWTKTGDSKMWMCDSAWFNKLIKMEYGGKVLMLLKKKGDDATLGLKFPGDGDEGDDKGGE